MTLAKQIEELAGKATPGPWRVGSQTGAPSNHVIDMGEPPKAPFVMFYEGSKFANPHAVAHTDGPIDERDASVQLIVLLRNNLPAIIAALKETNNAG